MEIDERAMDAHTDPGAIVVPRAEGGKPPTRGRPSHRHTLANYALVLAWVVLAIIFALASPAFFTGVNLQSILTSQAILLVLSIGLLPALAAGEYDLSAASVLGLAMVVVGYLNVLQGWPIGLAVAVAIGVGVTIGVVNALLIVRLNVASLVATLGVGTIASGAALGINVFAIGGIDDTLVSVMRTRVAGIQLVFFYALAFALVAWYVFQFTPLGRYLFFVGAGRDVAKLSGLRVDAIRVGALITSSTVAALAGVMLTGVLGSADPTIGNTYLLPAFASAFLGATAIVPGRFNAIGTFVAVYFLATGVTGLQLLGLSGWVEQVFYGGSLIAAVVFSRMFARFAR
jgi:ribose transport system permease protein